MYDLIIRNGLVIDGSGGAGEYADVAIRGDRITEVGRVPTRALREIDAAGCLVTPGFIDAHTHLDAQVFWDPLGTCSCWHGVTTAVMGHCGFTLAPCEADARHLVTRNLERAEDIPGEALAAGVEWSWETFVEYLDALDRLPKGINFAANVGHSAVRTWAMGEQAFERAATDAECERMESALRDALEAGAVGFSTSRNDLHMTSDDWPVASRLADWTELTRLVGVLGELGAGIFQLANERVSPGADPAPGSYWADLVDLAVSTRVPLAFGVSPVAGGREQLDVIDRIAEQGGRAVGLSHSRGVAVMLSFETQLPFDRLEEWRAFRAQPLDKQLRDLRDPNCRDRLVQAARHGDYGTKIVGAEARPPNYELMFPLQHPSPPYRSVAELAREKGVDPVDYVIDAALGRDLRMFFVQPAGNFSDEDILAVMRHPRTVMTFSDAGAHATQVADASIQTHLLAYWVRDRAELSIEEAVRMITYGPATFWGFFDRGLVRPGFMADLNVVDLDGLSLDMPELVADLPGGARRIVQRATGFRHTIVAGTEVLADGIHTGALPGRLLRGRLAQPAVCA
jgi:N-acyl-D-amino-acid deacylase